MLDREDWKDYQERKNGKANNTFALGFLSQAAVMQANLTGHQDWDRFLSYLQAGLEMMESDEAGLKEKVLSSGTVNHDDIMQLKLALADVKGMIRCMRMVLALPRDIMETGERAKERLKELKTD